MCARMGRGGMVGVGGRGRKSGGGFRPGRRGFPGVCLVFPSVWGASGSVCLLFRSVWEAFGSVCLVFPRVCLAFPRVCGAFGSVCVVFPGVCLLFPPGGAGEREQARRVGLEVGEGEAVGVGDDGGTAVVVADAVEVDGVGAGVDRARVADVFGVGEVVEVIGQRVLGADAGEVDAGERADEARAEGVANGDAGDADEVRGGLGGCDAAVAPAAAPADAADLGARRRASVLRIGC